MRIFWYLLSVIILLFNCLWSTSAEDKIKPSHRLYYAIALGLGIVVISLADVVILIAICYCLCRKRKVDKESESRFERNKANARVEAIKDAGDKYHKRRSWVDTSSEEEDNPKKEVIFKNKKFGSPDEAKQTSKEAAKESSKEPPKEMAKKVSKAGIKEETNDKTNTRRTTRGRPKTPKALSNANNPSCLRSNSKSSMDSPKEDSSKSRLSLTNIDARVKKIMPK